MEVRIQTVTLVTADLILYLYLLLEIGLPQCVSARQICTHLEDKSPFPKLQTTPIVSSLDISSEIQIKAVLHTVTIINFGSFTGNAKANKKIKNP